MGCFSWEACCHVWASPREGSVSFSLSWKGSARGGAKGWQLLPRLHTFSLWDQHPRCCDDPGDGRLDLVPWAKLLFNPFVPARRSAAASRVAGEGCRCAALNLSFHVCLMKDSGTSEQ